MGIFSRSKKKDKLALVFHIGSSSVGGALFKVQASGIPEIIISLREPITLQKTLNIDKFLASTIKALEIVVGKIYKAGMGKPEEIFCVLSSPWHVSETRIIKLEKNAPFLFTAKLALELIQKEISAFEAEHEAEYLYAGNPVRSIEFKNIKTMLNGYESVFPLDQRVRELEMATFISISPEQVLKQAEKAIGKCFHFKNIGFSSFKLASFAVVRDIYAHNEDFLLIDIDGETTDISMVKKNTLRESVSYPLGCNFVTRKVASALHSTLSEADSLISLWRDGHAAEAVGKRIGSVIDELKKEWLSKFQESLANISNDISIPAAIYLSVEKEMADFFSETIKTEQFNQYTLTESKFKITYLGAEVFHGMVAFNEGVLRDSFLIISAIYINRFLNSSASPVLAGEAWKA